MAKDVVPIQVYSFTVWAFAAVILVTGLGVAAYFLKAVLVTVAALTLLLCLLNTVLFLLSSRAIRLHRERIKQLERFMGYQQEELD